MVTDGNKQAEALSELTGTFFDLLVTQRDAPQPQLIPALDVLPHQRLSPHSEISALEQEVATLSERLETRKVVERAKGLLQVKQGMTEPEAFKWIQRAAMDRRTSMKRVAEVVLETLGDAPKEGSD